MVYVLFLILLPMFCLRYFYSTLIRRYQFVNKSKCVLFLVIICFNVASRDWYFSRSTSACLSDDGCVCDKCSFLWMSDDQAVKIAPVKLTQDNGVVSNSPTLQRLSNTTTTITCQWAPTSDILAWVYLTGPQCFAKDIITWKSNWILMLLRMFLVSLPSKNTGTV